MSLSLRPRRRQTLRSFPRCFHRCFHRCARGLKSFLRGSGASCRCAVKSQLLGVLGLQMRPATRGASPPRTRMQLRSAIAIAAASPRAILRRQAAMTKTRSEVAIRRCSRVTLRLFAARAQAQHAQAHAPPRLVCAPRAAHSAALLPQQVHPDPHPSAPLRSPSCSCHCLQFLNPQSGAPRNRVHACTPHSYAHTAHWRSAH